MHLDIIKKTDKKKDINKIDYEKIYGPEFLNILSRIEDLEDISKTLNREFELKLLSWDSDISEAKRKLNKIKEQINIIKSQIEEFKKNFINIVFELKLCVNQEDFDKLRKKVEDFQFEKFITKNEFLKMLEDVRDERNLTLQSDKL